MYTNCVRYDRLPILGRLSLVSENKQKRRDLLKDNKPFKGRMIYEKESINKFIGIITYDFNDGWVFSIYF